MYTDLCYKMCILELRRLLHILPLTVNLKLKTKTSLQIRFAATFNIGTAEEMNAFGIKHTGVLFIPIKKPDYDL